MWHCGLCGRLTVPAQRADLNKPDLPIIAGKQAQAVTRTPADGETFKIGDITVKALYTPCHTQDSICWYMQDGDDRVVFTGDTLFHAGKFTESQRILNLVFELIRWAQDAGSSSRVPAPK